MGQTASRVKKIDGMRPLTPIRLSKLSRSNSVVDHASIVHMQPMVLPRYSTARSNMSVRYDKNGSIEYVDILTSRPSFESPDHKND